MDHSTLEGATEDDDWVKDVSSAVVVYAAMLGATIAGQFAGISIDVAFESHDLWAPLACSVVFEGIAGARVGAAKKGRPLTLRELTRLTATYTVGLSIVSLGLAVWIQASTAAAGPLGPLTVIRVILAIAVVLAAGGARLGLMVLATPRRR
ncbi:MAG: hypothetical protein ABSC94_21235 [Polyangiaceae bacterium]|jgi:hypothetical protein